MEKFSEYSLVIGQEYFLDKGKTIKGVLVKIDQGQIFFKTSKRSTYDENEEGLTSFRMENYGYETI